MMISGRIARLNSDPFGGFSIAGGGNDASISDILESEFERERFDRNDEGDWARGDLECMIVDVPIDPGEAIATGADEDRRIKGEPTSKKDDMGWAGGVASGDNVLLASLLSFPFAIVPQSHSAASAGIKASAKLQRTV